MSKMFPYLLREPVKPISNNLPQSKRLHKFFQSENINFFALVCPPPLPLYQDSYLLLFLFCFNWNEFELLCLLLFGFPGLKALNQNDINPTFSAMWHYYSLQIHVLLLLTFWEFHGLSHWKWVSDLEFASSQVTSRLPHFFFFNFYLFIYLWLCWVFVSVRGLSPVVASGGHSSSRCTGLSLSWPLLLRTTGSRCAGSVIVAHGPSCSAACGIFPDQGSNPCPLHWQADSQPLHHQGSPCLIF